MEFREIIFGSPQYEQEVKLRQKILRTPLGLDLAEENLDTEDLQLHFGLFENEELKACVLIQPYKDTHVKLRQMAVADDTQGKGYGSIMIQEVETYLKSIGFDEIILHARKSATGFYEKLGYVTFDNGFTEVGIAHFKMKKAIKSPL
jgi:predicted GNAT family N-acyltransferase